MSEAVAPDGADDAARLARESDAVAKAVRLARWVGDEPRQVTAGEVLRRADVSAVGAELGVAVPAKVRSAADVPALHVPWCTAVALGLLQVGDGEARSGPALAHWPPADDELLAGWLAGLRTVCAAGSDARFKDGVGLLVLAMLMTFDNGRQPGEKLWPAADAVLRDLCDLYGKPYWRAWDAGFRYSGPEVMDPTAGLFVLLAAFGTVTGTPARPRVTPLGRWALTRLREGLPEPVSPVLPAEDLLVQVARFGRDAERYHVVSQWLGARTAADAAREVLTAAGHVSPSLRLLAVDLAESFGDEALPVWREMSSTPSIGPHARAVLARYGAHQEMSDADVRWLAVERAAATLAEAGPDEALSCVYNAVPGADVDSCLAAVRASGHPDAEPLARALAEFAASGVTRSMDQVIQLKVTLTRCRPPIWRRVLVHATITLADLHLVVQILYGWDGDHLYAFTVGDQRYSDPYFGLEETADDGGLRVQDAFRHSAKKISYRYDFGTCWDHEITLESRSERQPGQAYPACVAFRGDSPVEYWDGDEPAEPEPFSLTETNRHLAALAEPDSP